MNNEEKLKRLFDLMDADGLTKTEFVKNFQIVIDLIKTLKIQNSKDFEYIISLFDKKASAIEEKEESDFKQLESKLTKTVKDQVENMYSDWAKMSDKIQARIIELKDGEDADEERVAEMVLAKIPPQKILREAPEETRDKLEQLTGDERLDKSAIKGIDEALAQIAGTGKATFVSGTAKPIRILNNGTVVDKNVRHINFKGTAVTSVVRNTDGTVDVTLTAGSGGETSVYNEIVSGSGTSFILAETPTSGTLRLFGYGQRLTPGVGNDYTLSGATITLTNSFDVGAILADYSYS